MIMKIMYCDLAEYAFPKSINIWLKIFINNYSWGASYLKIKCNLLKSYLIVQSMQKLAIRTNGKGVVLV